MKKLLLLAPLLILLSCGRQKFIPTTGTPVKMRHVSNKTERQVIVYTKKADVPADLKQIGIVNSSNTNSDKVFVKARNFTARAGGTACLLVDKDEMKNHPDKESNTWINPNLITKRWAFIVYE